MIKILTFSTLYPNAAQPHHGIFVEQRLRRLVASGTVDVRVMAPVPWFPSRHRWFGEYSAFAAAPHSEERHGIRISHPRFPTIPKFGMTIAPMLLASAVWPAVKRLRESGFDFDLIDAHYFYPDGVAAATLAERCGVPFVVTARGTDLNLIPQHRAPRKMILAASARAAAVITVCEALRSEAIALGMPADHVITLRNGVDLEHFRLLEKVALRSKLGFHRRTLLSVGRLIERKGHHIAIAALRELPDVDLVIVGDGPMQSALVRLATETQVADRVRFAGARTHAQLVEYYNAADALVLASDREGMANVLLESLACGTPLIANPAWGTPEVVSKPAAGVLMRERSAAALADAARQLFAAYPQREDTRAHAETFGWDHTTRGQIELFSRIVAAPAALAPRAI